MESSGDFQRSQSRQSFPLMAGNSHLLKLSPEVRISGKIPSRILLCIELSCIIIPPVQMLFSEIPDAGKPLNHGSLAVGLGLNSNVSRGEI